MHHDNRSSHLVEAVGSQQHGNDILGVGFSWLKCADATAAQAPPMHTPDYKKLMTSNKKLVELSNNMIPPLVDLQIASLGSSFTNTFLRQCKAGVNAAIPDLADEQGNLNMQKLGAGRDNFRDAVENGLVWTVLHWSCFIVWPSDLSDLLQRTLNIVPKGEVSEIEVMLWVQAQANKQIAANGEANWPQIQHQASLSLPSCATWISSIVKVRDGEVQQ